MNQKQHMVYIYEFDPKNPAGRLFKYPLDSGLNFDYRARVSSNCFFFGKGRNVKGGRCSNGYPKPSSIIYDFHHEGDSFCSGLIKSGVPIIELNNIWEFYKAIGYDYKKQKWL